MKQIMGALSLLCLAMGLYPAAGWSAVIKDIRMWHAPDHSRIVFDMDRTSRYEVFTLENPGRVVIDLGSAQLIGRRFDRVTVYDHEVGGAADCQRRRLAEANRGCRRIEGQRLGRAERLGGDQPGPVPSERHRLPGVRSLDRGIGSTGDQGAGAQQAGKGVRPLQPLGAHPIFDPVGLRTQEGRLHRSDEAELAHPLDVFRRQ